MRGKTPPGFHGETFRAHICPNCGKQRMYRLLGYVPNHRKIKSMDSTKERFIDVCDACLRKYANEDADYLNTKVKVAKKALENGEKLPEGISLEDALVDDCNKF